MLCNQLFHSMKADIDYLLLLYFSLDTEGMWEASTSITRTTSDISPGNSSTYQVEQAKNSQFQIAVVEKRPLWDGQNNIIVRESRSSDLGSLVPGTQAHLLGKQVIPALLAAHSSPHCHGLQHLWEDPSSSELDSSPTPASLHVTWALPPLRYGSTLLFLVISNYWAMLPNLGQTNLGLIHASIRENVKEPKEGQAAFSSPIWHCSDWFAGHPPQTPPHRVRDAATLLVQNFIPRRKGGNQGLSSSYHSCDSTHVNPDFLTGQLS